MSLIVRSNSTTPVPSGTRLAVCNLLVDLGMQHSEMFNNSSVKVLIGWEFPGLTYETDDGIKCRTITKQYTMSLAESAKLRLDLESWRGRAFTDKELEAFDLRNIVGKSCYLNIVHNVKGQKTYANVGAVMALPDDVAPEKLSCDPIIYDIDDDPVTKVDELPEWIKDIVTKSKTYQNKLTAPPVLTEVKDEEDGQLPF